jgi:putative membrane protein
MAVTTKDSLKQSMDLAIKHYASLFRLPSHRGIVLLQAAICIGGAVVSTVVLYPNNEGFFNGFLLGFSLFIITSLLDYAVSKLVLRQDPIYDLRRTAMLSLFSLGVWLFFMFLGDVVAMLRADLAWWVRLCLLGFSAVQILRLTVFNASSNAGCVKLVVASLLQPVICIIPFIAVWVVVGYPVTVQMLLFLLFSPVVGFASSYAFLRSINTLGNYSLGVPPLSLFKAFLLNWIGDLNAPFEEFLEKLGEEKSVELSLIKFDSTGTKTAIVIPSVHPGPFKNIGSSILPSLLKSSLENRFDCVACVPHGLFGHELDLASQLQNQKIVTHVIEAMNFEPKDEKASPFVTVSNGLATACCQIFGDFAFLSVTLAPKTTEDFPQELGFFVRQEAKEHGLSCCAVVNAHNCIDATNGVEDTLDSLKQVAATCLEKTVSLKRLPFEVGAATVFPNEFTLGDGMGRGGITAVVVKVGDQKAAYVVIDGNNMVSGLRERILSALNSFGVDTGEVYTTDTHSVNAVVVGQRGYSPIGEAIEHDKLIAYIEEATAKALSNLERVRAGCRSINVFGVKVIGEERLEKLSLLTDKGLQRAKKAAVPIFGFSGLVLMLFLLLV